jgi:hypothetical protein
VSRPLFQEQHLPAQAPFAHNGGGGGGGRDGNALDSQHVAGHFLGTTNCTVQRNDMTTKTMLRTRKTTDQRFFVEGSAVPNGDVVAVNRLEPPFAHVTWTKRDGASGGGGGGAKAQLDGYIQLKHLHGGRAVVTRNDTVQTTALRSEPTQEQRAFVPTRVRNHDAVEVLFRSGEWAFVRAADGGVGYMQQKHFQP